MTEEEAIYIAIDNIENTLDDFLEESHEKELQEAIKVLRSICDKR